MSKTSSILNNDFYIFILIFLLIIMLFMLSPKNKERFNINISKYKLKDNKNDNKNNKYTYEPFLNDVLNKYYEVKTETEGNKVKTTLTVSSEIVEDTYILKNNIIKLYNTKTDKESQARNVNYFYFNIVDAQIIDDKFILSSDTIMENDKITALNNNRELDSIKVIGNTTKNALLIPGNILLNDVTPDLYNLVFTQHVDLYQKMNNIFNNNDVIELVEHSKPEIKNKLFLIQDIIDNKIKLKISKPIEEPIIEIINPPSNCEEFADSSNPNPNQNCIIYSTNDILIKKFDLNEIIQDYYREIKKYNVDYLLRKKNIKNLNNTLDNIKERINK